MERSPLFQAGMHGFVGGMMSAADDENYLSGFASGVVSSLVGSGIKGLGTTNGSVNGFGSSGIYKAVTIAGGNFWMGVRQGVITGGLNHLAHSVARMTQGKPNFSKIRTVDNVLKNKVYISYYAYNNSGDAARAQNLEGGANPVYQDGRVDLYSDLTRQSPALDVRIQKAIDVVINNLLNGKPVMAGVMFTHKTSPGNANIATNHYINLVGMGIEDVSDTLLRYYQTK